jgi:GAF domain-containing protein
VGQQVSGELEPDVLLSTIVSAVHDAFEYHNVTLLLLDEETGRLTKQSVAGAYADILPSDLSLAIGEGLIGYAAATRETQLSNDVTTDPHYVRKVAGATRSELAVPIKSGDAVIGVLDLQDDDFDAFDDLDVTILETLSTQIATAIENARLFQAERRVDHPTDQGITCQDRSVVGVLSLDGHSNRKQTVERRRLDFDAIDEWSRGLRIERLHRRQRYALRRNPRGAFEQHFRELRLTQNASNREIACFAGSRGAGFRNPAQHCE